VLRGFMVHQVIAGVDMVILFVVGSSWWVVEPDVLSSDPARDTAARRLFVAHATARWCCAAVLGEFVLRDILRAASAIPVRPAHVWTPRVHGGRGMPGCVPPAYYLFFFFFFTASWSCHPSRCTRRRACLSC